jgi:hypothetical protein
MQKPLCTTDMPRHLLAEIAGTRTESAWPESSINLSVNKKLTSWKFSKFLMTAKSGTDEDEFANRIPRCWVLRHAEPWLPQTLASRIVITQIG